MKRAVPPLQKSAKSAGACLCFALLAIGLTGQAGAAGAVSHKDHGGAQISTVHVPAAKQADFAAELHSRAAGKVADWVVVSADNGKMPFVIIDKVNAKLFAFDDQGTLRGAAPVLLGMSTGDESPAGIGTRKLSAILPAERITPAGRFIASLGNDLSKQDILWVDYPAAISLHRVFVGNPSEQRLQRLATATVADNRISYGCINVSAGFYERVIRPIFRHTSGVVYVLPERKSLAEVFGIGTIN